MKNFFKAQNAPAVGTHSHRLCAITIAAVIGFSMLSCGGGGGGKGSITITDIPLTEKP